jgi:hypothetical protein
LTRARVRGDWVEPLERRLLGQNDGIVARIIVHQFREAFGSDFIQHGRAQQFRVPVLPQTPRHHFRPDQRILRLPRFRRVTQQRKFERQFFLMRIQKRIHAARIRVQDAVRSLTGVSEIIFRRASQADDALPAVRIKRDRANEFRQTPRREPPIQFHVPQTVLRVNESLREKNIVVAFRVNVRHAPFVANDFNG